MTSHPYTRFGEALVRVENSLSVNEDITAKHLSDELVKGINAFRLAPITSYNGKTTVKYDYVSDPQGNPSKGIFLAPNVISSDKRAKNIWAEVTSIANELITTRLDKVVDVKMSVAPMAGEYLTFSLTSSIGRGKPKATLRNVALNAITSLTPLKPCFQYGYKGSVHNACVVPDLPIERMMDFIRLYKKLTLSRACGDLFLGRVLAIERGDSKPLRPTICFGNFPNPPRSYALRSVALLGAIGEFAKEADVSTLAEGVLESLKGTSMYLITYGEAHSFSYNHHVIDLAKIGRLREIVDGLYYSTLYGQGPRRPNSPEYVKFDLFSSRFLLLFNRPALQDFLASRAEYPNTTTILFSTYFQKVEMIQPEIIDSAKKLGKWLNQVAYFTARNDIKPGNSNYWEELRRAKAKVLVELESSVFSAKTGDALVAQVVTRAGRLSNLDAPEGAALFMKKTASGELSLDVAKNLLIAFSRLRNKVEQRELPKEVLEDDDDSQDLSGT